MTASASRPVTSLTSGAVRSVRAALVAFAAVAIAVASHGAAGGTIPPAVVIAAMLAAAAPLCWALSAHRWSARELLGVFLLAQSAVHLLSMATTHHGDAMDMSGPLGLSAPMVISHVAGAALLIVMVRSGETVLWNLVEVLALRPLHRLLVIALPAPRSRLVEARRLDGLIVRPWRALSVDRGPPGGCASLSFT